MSDYCLACEKEVSRCWSSDSGCSGGGHCMECMGYHFEETEEQTEMREAHETLTQVLTKESDA